MALTSNGATTKASAKVAPSTRCAVADDGGTDAYGNDCTAHPGQRDGQVHRCSGPCLGAEAVEELAHRHARCRSRYFGGGATSGTHVD